ncbi:MAG: hypothetical protein Q9162_007400 [Coniocarpon cinnabarinum]
MLTTSNILVALSVGFAAAAPTVFPLPDGFPNLAPGSPQLQQVQTTAGGTLGNGPPPTGLAPDTVNSFGLIAFNEILEVAFFSELVSNIRARADGYQLDPLIEAFNLKVLDAVVAFNQQEELHALTANAIRQANNADAIQPCSFKFPVGDFESAIALAQTLTDVVLGVLQDVEVNAITANGVAGAPLMQAISSILGQEGQQDGYYRTLQLKRPSAEPFLTGNARAFAFNALRSFVDGDCPSLNEIHFPVFGPLNVVNQPCGDETVYFNVTTTANSTIDEHSQKLVYLNGGNLPLVQDFKVENKTGDVTVLSAFFPHDKNVMDGLTVAAIVKADGKLDSNDGVADATLFGPGLIEVN